jgi:hypothetical protein
VTISYRFASMGATGLEPVTPSLSSEGTSDASETAKGLVTTHPAACTAACTSEPGNAQPNTLDALAAALLGLSQEDRTRLAAMLLAGNKTEG